jgi:Transglutaminase-like superfamily
VIQTLAEQITNGQSRPYDQAETITNYLRKTIQYSTTIPSPPLGEDPAVWVLFDYKKGFCNYYASAEVLMLRSIGIPARMAVGFAEGESPNDLSDNKKLSYTVLERDAHAWPEVYFPGIGWVEFEPTVNQNPIVRPQTKSQIAAQQNNSSNVNSNQPKENPSGPSANPVIFNIPGEILFIGFSLLFAGLIVFAFHRYHLLHQAPVYLSNGLERIGVLTPSWINAWMNWNQMTSVEHSFASINLSLKWLGSPQPISATAAERAAQLAKLLPSATTYIEMVAFEHQTALFTRRSADLTRARRAGMIIIFLTLRFKLLNFWSAIFGGDVYSG